MDREFGFHPPSAIAAITLPQSAPGAWTSLAAFLFRPGRQEPRAAAAAAPERKPANDRFPPARHVGIPCLRLIGR